MNKFNDDFLKLSKGPKYTSEFLNSKINAETERAEQVEAELDEKIDNVNSHAEDLVQAEEDRAKEAEQAELERAQAVEEGLDNRLSTVESKIPAEASASNQLADKKYVDDNFMDELEGLVVIDSTSSDISGYENGQLFFVKNEDSFYTKTSGHLVLFYDLNKYRDKIGVLDFTGRTIEYNTIYTLTAEEEAEKNKPFCFIKYSNKVFIPKGTSGESGLGIVIRYICETLGVTLSPTTEVLTKYIFSIQVTGNQFRYTQEGVTFYPKDTTDLLFVHKDLEETLTGKKTFDAGLVSNGQSEFNAEVIIDELAHVTAEGDTFIRVGDLDNFVAYQLPHSEDIGHTHVLTDVGDVASAEQSAVTTAGLNADTKIANAFTNANVTGTLNVSGNTTVGGDLTVEGIITSVDTKTISTEERYIQMMKGNTVAVSGYVGHVVPKYNGTNDFFFGMRGNVYVIGKVTATFNAKGDVIGIEDISLVPLAARAEDNLFTDGNLIMWDASTKTFVDSGFNPSAIAQAEAIRVSNEDIRIQHENTRIANENTRISNEIKRQDALRDMLRTHPDPIMLVDYRHLVDDGYYCNWYYEAEEQGQEPKWHMTVDATADVDALYSFPYQDDVLYSVNDQYDISDLETDVDVLKATMPMKQDKINGFTDNTTYIVYTGDFQAKKLTQTEANVVFNYGAYEANPLGTITDSYSRGEVINNVIYLIGNFTLTVESAGILNKITTLTMTLPASIAVNVWDFDGHNVADPALRDTIITSIPNVAIKSTQAGLGSSNYVDCFCEIYNTTFANILKIEVMTKEALSVAIGDTVSVMFRVPLTLI